MFTNTPPQPIESNKVRIAWDAEQEQIAEIDKMIEECRERSNKNFLLGTIMATCLFGVSLYALLNSE